MPENVDLLECSKCNYKTLKAPLMTRHLAIHKKNSDKPKGTKTSKRTSMSFCLSIHKQRLVLVFCQAKVTRPNFQNK